MRFICLLTILLLPFPLFAQDGSLEKRVMRKYENGTPHVILFFDKESGNLAREEVFFSNGKTHWAGDYKNNLENGLWQFFWENGNLKANETYLKGKEHGVSTLYDLRGNKIKESYWKHGKLIKEITF